MCIFISFVEEISLLPIAPSQVVFLLQHELSLCYGACWLPLLCALWIYVDSSVPPLAWTKKLKLDKKSKIKRSRISKDCVVDHFIILIKLKLNIAKRNESWIAFDHATPNSKNLTRPTCSVPKNTKKEDPDQVMIWWKSICQKSLLVRTLLTIRQFPCFLHSKLNCKGTKSLTLTEWNP